MGLPTAILGVTSAIGLVSGQKQKQAQKQQSRDEQKLAAMENNRRLRAAQREARRATAMTQAQAAGTGQLGSSSTTGVLSSIQSQIAGNIEYMESAASLTQSLQAARQRQADWGFYGQLARLGGQVGARLAQPTGLVDPGNVNAPVQPQPQTQQAPVYTTTPAIRQPGTTSSSIFR